MASLAVGRGPSPQLRAILAMLPALTKSELERVVDEAVERVPDLLGENDR